MSSRQGPSGLPRRRNGKQQACEPCRKAKMACDHTFPVCDRCKRRRIVPKCLYLAAPMTNPARQSGWRAPVVKSPSIATPQTDSSGMSTSQSTSTILTDSGMSTSQTALSMRTDSFSKPPATESGPFIKSGGFFGPTHFSAVFIENRENLGNDDMHISNDLDPGPGSQETPKYQTFMNLAGNEHLDLRRVALGVKVLSALPDRLTFTHLASRYADKCPENCFHKPTIVSCADSIWETYGKQLDEPRTAENMEYISSILCKNAETAHETSSEDEYKGWVASFCGLNLRWEIVGLVIAALVHGITSLDERDAFFTTQRGHRMDRKQFTLEMQDCVQTCITLSNYMDLINLQMVALLAKSLSLQTIISGDTSLLVWRQTGGLVSACTALGLHRYVDDGRSPSFVSELRKRIFILVFIVDKGVASLTGRPPALSDRYVRWNYPYDISDEVLMEGREAIAKAVEALDPDGWNVEGNLFPATTTRAYGRLHAVLTEILELTLGDPAECTNARIQSVMGRLEQIYGSNPSFLRWRPEDTTSGKSLDRHFWIRLMMRVGFLEYRLLLERLAHKQGLLDGQSMVDCAREMLELVVFVWVQRDRFPEHHHDFDWLLLCWGVPSSGVLCVELLKQMKQPPGTVHVPYIPRSEVVQNLSLLIGFLEWIRPAAGSYQLCLRMRQVIKRILDQILNPPTAPPAATHEPAVSVKSDSVSGVEPFDATVFETGGYDDCMDSLDWLNTVDWSRGPWIDLGGLDMSTAAKWN